MIDVNWNDSANNIVVWKFTAPWTFPEFYAAQKEVDAMIDTVEGYVDSIFLTSLEQKIPLYGLTHLRKIIAQQHKRHRYTVIVGARTFLSSLLKLISEYVPNFKSQLHFAASQADALSLLSKIRASQNPS